MNKKLTALFILDGWGATQNVEGNAVYAAKTPNLDALFEKWPHTEILCSGMDVGLPQGQMGNSEVGHTNIGAGRIVYQELTRITKSIMDGDFFQNEELLGAIQNCKHNDSSLHLMGLVSDGGVHSHNTHLYALLKLAKMQGLQKVYVHCILDGRDVPPSSGADYVAELQQEIQSNIGVGEIASVSGRYYAMDRDKQWARLEKAYAAYVYGVGIMDTDPVQAIRDSYGKGVTDEFVLPVVVTKDDQPIATVNPNDSVIFFNFRPDRAREITRAFTDPDFDFFKRSKGFMPLYYVCMTQYDASMPNVHVAYKPESLTNTFGEYISGLGLTQLRIAETTKYAHVTFFFNGGTENVYQGEDRVLIPTPDVATFDLKPSMSAYEVAEQCVERIESGKYDVIILNFANCDMVGHTGIFDAAVQAVEAVDQCVGKVVDCVLRHGGEAIITADHGNAEEMLDADGNVWTAHSTNPVPLILAGRQVNLKKGGRLADIAPTLLDMLDICKPPQMKGESLIVK